MMVVGRYVECRGVNREGTCAINAVVPCKSLMVSLLPYAAYMLWTWWSRWLLSVDSSKRERLFSAAHDMADI